ncbi:MAG: hypothetical protein ABR562_00385 [Thermoplasmatota archaeon]|nr:hypothetical protein [Halobacteriales archaeon]
MRVLLLLATAALLSGCSAHAGKTPASATSAPAILDLAPYTIDAYDVPTGWEARACLACPDTPPYPGATEMHCAFVGLQGYTKPNLQTCAYRFDAPIDEAAYRAKHCGRVNHLILLIAPDGTAFSDVRAQDANRQQSSFLADAQERTGAHELCAT